MTVEVKNFEDGEIRDIPFGRGEFVTVGGHPVAQLVLEPGWSWAKSVKPIVGGESCQVEHLNVIVAGKIKITMDDGESFVLGAGDVTHLPAGHHAEVVSDVPVRAYDFSPQMTAYAAPSE